MRCEMSRDKAIEDLGFKQILRDTEFMSKVFYAYQKYGRNNPQDADYNAKLLEIIKVRFPGEKFTDQVNLRSKLTHVFQEKNNAKLNKIFGYSAASEVMFKKQLAMLSELLPPVRPKSGVNQAVNSVASLRDIFKKYEQRFLSRPNYQPAIQEALKFQSVSAMINAFLNKYIEITDAYKRAPPHDSPINIKILEHLVESFNQDFQEAIRTLATQPKNIKSIENCFSGRTKEAVEMSLISLKPHDTNTK